MMDLNSCKNSQDSRLMSCVSPQKMETENEPDLIKTRRRKKKSTSPPAMKLSYILFILTSFAVGAMDCQSELVHGKILGPSAGPPSQLFLPQPQPISRVSGFYPKKTTDEEEEGFIMQAASTPATNATPPSATDAADTEEPTATLTGDATTITPTSLAPGDQTTTGYEGGARLRRLEENSGVIPIDVNRQQFLTHDQLNLNARTKDEPSVSVDLSRVQSSRTDRSKVSHGLSFLSDIFASYASRARQPIDDQQAAKKQQAAPATCPGTCMSILSAPLFCKHEIDAPCPTLLQKCCDRNDVSFNGTPVETSAPFTPADSTDPNPAPLSDQSAQTQNHHQNERQTTPTSPATTPPIADKQATQSTSDPSTELSTAAATTTTTTVTSEQPATQQQRLGSGSSGQSESPSATDYLLGGAVSANQPATVYFLSSGTGSQQEQRAPSSNSRNEGPQAQPANENKQQQQHSAASQSFDMPLSEQTASARQPSEKRQQVVVVQTANGTILHQSAGPATMTEQVTTKPLVARNRPAYINWTDYQMTMKQIRPSTGQPVVYHSNIDPVKRFVSTEKPQATTVMPATTSSPTTTTMAAATEPQVTCEGICMRKVHFRSCAVAAGRQQLTSGADLSPEGCSLADEFCCMQTAQVTFTESDQNNIRRTAMLIPPASSESESRGDRVIMDQHSAPRTSAATTTKTTPAPVSTSTSTTTTTSAPLTTTTAPTTNSNEPAVGNEPISLVGRILGSLFDSYVTGGSPSQQSDEPQAGHATDHVVSFADSPTANKVQQNDHRYGYDLSYRQQQAAGNRQQFDDQTATTSDLMTSEGDTNQPASSQQSTISPGQQQTCEESGGFCSLEMFSMLCDQFYSTPDCQFRSKCCRKSGVAPSQASGQDDQMTTLAGNPHDQVPSSLAPNEASTCRGTCLPIYHSSLCTKPSEIDTISCLPNQVCCQPPAIAHDQVATTNQLDDLVDSMMTGASGPSPGFEGKQTTSSSPLYVSLVPPPPPPVAQNLAAVSERQQDVNGRAPNLILDQQQTRQRQGHLAEHVPAQGRIVFTPQPTTSTSRPTTANAKNAQSGGGLISHIYQMFKPSGSGKQRQKNQPQPQLTQHQILPHLPNYGYLPQIDPTDAYLSAAHQYHQQQASHPLNVKPALQQQPLIYPVQQQNLLLSGPAAAAAATSGQHFNPTLVNGYQSELDAAAQQQQVAVAATRNNRVQHPAHHQHVVDQQQQLISGHSMQQQQRPAFVAHHQQVHNKINPSQYHQVATMNSMGQFNEQQNNNHLLHRDKFSQQPSSELNPSIVSFASQQDQTAAAGVAAPKPLANGNTNKQVVAASLTQFGAGSQSAPSRQFQQPDNAHQFNQQQQQQSRQQAPQQVGYNQYLQQQQSQLNGFVAQPQAQAARPVALGANGGHPSVRQTVAKQQPHQLGAASVPLVAPAADHSSQQYHRQQQQQLHLSGSLQPSSSRGSAGNSALPANGLQQSTGAAQSKQQTTRPFAVTRSPVTDHQVNNPQQGSLVAPASSVNRGGLQPQPVQNQNQNQNQHQYPSSAVQSAQRFSVSSQQSTRQQPWQPQPPSQVATSDDDVQQCTSSCLSPLVSFNCIKPNHIDHNLRCPTSGAVCCVKGAIQEQLPESQSSAAATESTATSTLSTVSMVTSNKLDSTMSLADQDDQMDEMSKQQQSDSASGDSISNSPDLDSAANQQPPVKSSRPATCGLTGPRSRAQSGRIMGGFEAKPGHWCWQAALMNSESEYLCGGALIGGRWVLTAAHCVTQQLRSESPLYVRLGQHNLRANASSKPGHNILVKTTYVHHNHNGLTLDNDIALLRLEDSADLDDPNVCLVCLPERSSQVEPGKRCTVTGYGFEDEEGPAALRVRQTDLPIIADQECQPKLSSGVGNGTFTLPANSFCAGGELGQDACHGDGGSPLSCQVDGYYELTGIVSWGYKCGRKDLPGLYSKVSTFVGWINQIVSVNN